MLTGALQAWRKPNADNLSGALKWEHKCTSFTLRLKKYTSKKRTLSHNCVQQIFPKYGWLLACQLIINFMILFKIAMKKICGHKNKLRSSIFWRRWHKQANCSQIKNKSIKKPQNPSWWSEMCGLQSAYRPLLHRLTLLQQLCSQGCTLGLPLQLEMFDGRCEGSHQSGQRTFIQVLAFQRKHGRRLALTHWGGGKMLTTAQTTRLHYTTWLCSDQWMS